MGNTQERLMAARHTFGPFDEWHMLNPTIDTDSDEEKKSANETMDRRHDGGTPWWFVNFVTSSVHRTNVVCVPVTYITEVFHYMPSYESNSSDCNSSDCNSSDCNSSDSNTSADSNSQSSETTQETSSDDIESSITSSSSEYLPGHEPPNIDYVYIYFII